MLQIRRELSLLDPHFIPFHFDLLNRFLLWQSIINMSLLSCFIHPSVEFIPNPPLFSQLSPILMYCTVRILSFPSLPFPSLYPWLTHSLSIPTLKVQTLAPGLTVERVIPRPRPRLRPSQLVETASLGCHEPNSPACLLV